MIQHLNKTTVIKIIVLLIAVALLPATILGITSILSAGIDSVGGGITQLVTDLFQLRGPAKIEALIRICLWLIGVTLLAKFIFSRWK